MDKKQRIDQFVKYFEKNYLITDNGKIQMISKRSYFSTQEVYIKYVDLMSNIGSEPLSREEVEEIIRNLIAEKVKPEAPKLSVTDAVIQELHTVLNKRFRINSTFNQVYFKNDDSEVWTNSSIDDIMNWLQMRHEDSQILAPYKIGSIQAALKMLAIGARNKAQNDIVKKLKYDRTCEPTRDAVMHAIYDFLEVKQPYAQFEMAFLHWMWQVKRKISNQKVVWHIWLNLFGPTKIGKTWIVRHLCDPFADFYLESTIGTMMDQTKEVMKFTENFVINFEELAMNAETKFVGGEATMTADQMAVMKSMLTGDKMDTRIYGKQLQMKRDITFSCISTANYHLYDVFYDETSMRRYYEFDCRRSVPGSNEERANLNAMLAKAEDMWKGVDETREKGYWDEFSEAGKAIDAEQRAYMPTKSTIIAWNDYYEFIYDNDKETEDVYLEYKTWCKNMGFNSKTLLNFNTEIKKRYPDLIGNDGRPHFSTKSRNGKRTEETPLKPQKSSFEDRINDIAGGKA